MLRHILHQEEMEVYEWLENGLHLSCDHSYLPEIDSKMLRHILHKKEMEVHEWLANGLQLSCDHSYLTEIFYLIARCLGISFQN